jgi:hypothetical protein
VGDKWGKLFRSKDLEIIADYCHRATLSACNLWPGINVPLNAKRQELTVGNRDATLEKSERAHFDLDSEGDAKGFIICVPETGDGAQGFSFIGKYKDDKGYEALQRIVKSIRFAELQ